jgi:hypothetical protein
MKILNPYAHVLNASGTGCEDGTSKAGAVPCPACQWAQDQWAGCCRASNRLADLVCSMYHPRDPKARQTWPTATWAEIIAQELGIAVPKENK